LLCVSGSLSVFSRLDSIRLPDRGEPGARPVALSRVMLPPQATCRASRAPPSCTPQPCTPPCLSLPRPLGPSLGPPSGWHPWRFGSSSISCSARCTPPAAPSLCACACCDAQYYCCCRCPCLLPTLVPANAAATRYLVRALAPPSSLHRRLSLRRSCLSTSSTLHRIYIHIRTCPCRWIRDT
jgi:hypothetical protein